MGNYYFSYFLEVSIPLLISISTIILIMWSWYKLKVKFGGSAHYFVLFGGILFALPEDVRIIVFYLVPTRLLDASGLYGGTGFGSSSFDDFSVLVPYVRVVPPFFMALGLWLLLRKKNV